MEMETLNLISQYAKTVAGDYSDLINIGTKCKIIRDNEFRKLPFHINVISSAARGKLKETAHSMILHDLLHHPILLSSFLEEIVGIPADTFSKDDIRYPDQERIDLSLVSHKKNKFLIIENKVNAAEEQPGQIYRYVLSALENGFRLSDVIVLYLNPDNNAHPSLYSRSKDGKGLDGDEYTVPKEMINVRNYKYDILNWLKSKEKAIGINENLLKSSLMQYIDYLEEYFQTKDKFKELHDMTQEEIIKLLDLESLSNEERIEVLTSKIRELDNLRAEIEGLNRKLKVDEWNEVLNRIHALLSESYADRITLRKYSNTVPELGFDVKINNMILHVSIVYWTNQTPYWRIYSDKDLDNSIRNEIKNILTPYFHQIKGPSSKNWDIFCETSKENCGLRLEKLMQVFLASPDFEVVK